MRVLNAGKLNENAVRAAALDDRLTDAELVDAVSDGFDGLIDGELPNSSLFALVEAHHRLTFVGGRVGSRDESRKLVLQEIGERRALGRIAHLNVQSSADALELARGNLSGSQLSFQIFHRPVQCRLDRFVALHLEDEMDASLQIEAETQ